MTDQKKNILLLIPTFADEGGTQKMVCELGKLLAEKFNVYECSFNAFNEPHIFPSGNKVLSLNSSSSSSRIGKLIRYFSKARQLKKLKRKYSIDITISNLWAADLVNILSGGKDKKISIGHVNIIGNFQNRLLLKLRWFAKYIYYKFDKVVAVNKFLAKELQQVFHLKNEKIGVINNFVDLPSGNAEEKKLSRKKRLIVFGRLNEIKNHEPLIVVLNELKKSLPVQLVVMGAGPQKEKLLNFSRSLGLVISENTDDESADIIFTGFHPDPFSVLRSSDLFVFPSRSEGFGLVIVEAMHAGLPVITSDCPTGGPHMILQGKDEFNPGRKQPEETPYGFLMPIPELNDETITIWKNTVFDLLNNKQKIDLMKKNVQDRAFEFSKEKTKDEWFTLLYNL